MEPSNPTPGALLSLLMRRRGWSAARVAEVAQGVSASSVRAYTADRVVPRVRQALAVANVLGPRDGRMLLEAWGFNDLAEGFVEQWRRAMTGDDSQMKAVGDVYYRYNKIEYLGEPLSEAALHVAQSMIAWLQTAETAAAVPPTLPS
jgi:hypothetical protein